MVQLDFVGMNELFDSEEEENISEEAFYDNEEDSEEVDAKVKVAMEKKEEDDLVRTLALKSGQKSVEEDSEQESEEEAETEVTDEEVDKYLEKSISKTVHAYFIEKSKKMKKSDEFDFERRENVQEAEQNILYPDIYEPNWMRNIPYHPIDLTQKKEDSSEEPDDRIISWDKWVDDKVKPIRVRKWSCFQIFARISRLLTLLKRRKSALMKILLSLLKQKERVRRRRFQTPCSCSVCAWQFSLCEFPMKQNSSQQLFQWLRLLRLQKST